MAETSGPFDPVDPEHPVAPGEVLAEADWEAMVRHLVDGIPDLPTSTQLKPSLSESTARGIDLAAGLMLVWGRWYRSSAVKTLTSSGNSSGADRIDRAVARLNRTANTVTTTLVEGTPGSGQPPALTDTDTITDRPIARWTIGNGATAATNLVDERLFQAGPVLLCTSSTRPTAVKVGTLAYETDTGAVIVLTANGWQLVYDDTGWVDMTATWGTYWQVIGTTAARRRSGEVHVIIQEKRLLGGIAKSDPDGSLLVTLPVGMRPTHHFEYRTAQFTNGASARLQIQSNGEVWVNAFSADVAQGSLLRAGFSFLL